MIISHKYKFIFIKTYKTAGTSIEVYLSPLCDELDILTPINPHVEPHVARNHEGYWNPLPEVIRRQSDIRSTYREFRRRNKFYNHIPARLAKSRIGSRVWNSYYKFCVERNPWDKTVSHYHMVNDRLGGDLTLDDYFKRGRFARNFDKYTDENSRLMVDDVLRFERLNEDLTQVFSQLGVPFSGSLGVRAKSGHRSDKRSYRDILNGEQSEMVSRIYAKEIDLHGYTF